MMATIVNIATVGWIIDDSLFCSSMKTTSTYLPFLFLLILWLED